MATNVYDTLDTPPANANPYDALDKVNPYDALDKAPAQPSFTDDLQSGDPVRMARGMQTLSGVQSEMLDAGLTAKSSMDAKEADAVNRSISQADQPSGAESIGDQSAAQMNPVLPKGQGVRNLAEAASTALNASPLAYMGISPEGIQTAADFYTSKLPASFQPIARVAQIPDVALGKTVFGIADWMSTPGGMAQMAAAGIPVTKIPMAAKFFTDMASGAGQSAADMVDKWQKGDYQGFADSLAGTAANVLGAGALGFHATGGLADAIDTRVNPAGMLARELGRTPLQGTPQTALPIPAQEQPPWEVQTGNVSESPSEVAAPNMGRSPIPQPPKAPPVEVPATPAEPETQYSSVIDEIQKRNLTTKRQIQSIYPHLSLQEAAALRQQAWGDANRPAAPAASTGSQLDPQGELAQLEGLDAMGALPASQRGRLDELQSQFAQRDEPEEPPLENNVPAAKTSDILPSTIADKAKANPAAPVTLADLAQLQAEMRGNQLKQDVHGGAQEDLPPEQQSVSAQNNSPDAWAQMRAATEAAKQQSPATKAENAPQPVVEPTKNAPTVRETAAGQSQKPMPTWNDVWAKVKRNEPLSANEQKVWDDNQAIKTNEKNKSNPDGRNNPVSKSDASMGGSDRAGDDEALRTETTDSIVARTKVGTERDTAFAERAAASKRVSQSLQPGDVIVDDEGRRHVVDQVAKDGTPYVYQEGGDPNKGGFWSLTPDDVVEKKPTPTAPAEKPTGKESLQVQGDKPDETQQAKATEKPADVPSDDPFISSIANRFTEEKTKSGELGEIAPGEGYSTQDIVNRGLKMKPEEVSKHISDLENKKGGDPVLQAAAVRAEEARLSQKSQELSKASEANPNDLAAKKAADEAFKALTDFHKGPIAKLKTIFHGVGEGLQGEIPVDLSTFNGLREQWLRDHDGKEPPPRMEPEMRKTARNVRKAVADERDVTNRLGKEIERKTAGKKLPSPEDVRDSIINRMKDMPCRN